MATDKMTIEKAREEIEALSINPGEYGHNIVSCILRIIAKEYGYEASNKLVEELELGEIFSIPKFWPAINMLKGISKNEWEGPTATKYNVHPTGGYGIKAI